MNQLSKLLLTAFAIAQLTACVPVIVGGAAAGGAMAADRRTSGIYVEDQNIEIKAARKMETNLGEESHVNITSFNRNVLLTGEVPNAELKAKAEALVKTITNTRNVTNEIVITPKSSISDRANDTYITSKVKANFVAESNFSDHHVKIVTEASTVFLMGLVTQKEASIATEIARNTDGVKKVVKVFEYMP
jgi:osmotically-inducible protein OsmY